jgi:hypothetical protein
MGRRMRSFPRAARHAGLALAILVTLLLVERSAAASPPLLGVEARVGYGVAFGGTSSRDGWKLGTLTAGALAEYAVMDAPRVSLYGEAYWEGLKRGGFGVGGGVRLLPGPNGLRLGIGLTSVVVPYTHGGAQATVGECLTVRAARLCLDVAAAAYFFGGDLAQNGVDAQLRLVFAAGFNAL